MNEHRIKFNYQGPHKPLVDEVLDFAFSDAILSCTPNIAANSEMPLVLTDMVAAVDAAGGKGDLAYFSIDEPSDLRRHWFDDAEFDPEELEDDDFGSNLFSWYDLQQNLTARYIWTTEWYDWAKQHSDAVKVLESLCIKWNSNTRMYLDEHLHVKLPKGPRGPDRSVGYYQHYVINQVRSDLSKCAQNRAFNGLTDNYWEQLLKVYFAGLWPCGWQGTWPQPGRFIAWQRQP